MNENERNTYRLLRGWRRLGVKKQFFESRCDFSPAQREARLAIINQLLELLDSSMALLNADERYVIQRHLIDGIGWKCIVYEYNTKLWRPVKKSLSSLRRLQRSGVGKIAIHAEALGIQWDDAILAVLAGFEL